VIRLIKSRLIAMVSRLWNPSFSWARCSWFEKSLFLFLCLCEYGYRLGFNLAMRYKRWRGGKRFDFPIISVGNISVGGTGKSVFVSFLVDQLGPERVAVVLRGYKGSGKTMIVSDGLCVRCSATACGDEAMMYVLHYPNLRVAVGKNRARACALLEQGVCNAPQRLACVLLDDAYQNFDVKPSLNIILLDARFPFENGHCLPAGRLRELDCSRAEFIVITHADAIGSESLVGLKNLLARKVPGVTVLAGKHGARGLWEDNLHLMSSAMLVNRRLLVAAGVGSFDGVVQTVRACGATITATHAFGDHFNYKPSDITDLCLLAAQQQCTGIVVTEKDWVKVNPLLQKDVALHGQVSWYVIRVGFEFLSAREYDCLIKAIQQVI